MHIERLSRLRPQGSQAATGDDQVQVPGLPPANSCDRRAMLPPVPPEVVRVLESGILGRRFLFPEVGEARVVEDWQVPSLPPGPAFDGVAHYLAALEAALMPADRGLLLARILALLSHFRTEANPPQVEQMIADDWAEDLGIFPIWVVEEACRSWRRTKRWRPQICEMLALCTSSIGDAFVRRDRLRAVIMAAEACRNPLTARMQELAGSAFRRIPV
jgi:hypothetical protein